MKRILFVDDEPLVLRGLQRSLLHREDDWEMRFVGSGAEALTVLAHSHHDAIVTDMRMPGMNGAELLVKVWRSQPGIARLVLSGHADKDLLLQCATTAHQYLSKPCEATKLEAALERVLTLQSLIYSQAIGSLVGRVDNLPSCPELFHRITRSLAADDPDLASIGALVEQDCALTAKLLKLVNSAFFGLGYEVVTAGEAVNYLGTEVLKSLILATQIFDQCAHLAMAGLDTRSLWCRSLLTATCAKAIAEAQPETRLLKDEAFTAGLLHSCGLLVLAESLPAQLKQAITTARSTGTPLHVQERALFGATHAEIGGYLLGLWCLPLPIVEAILFHPAGPPPEAPAAPLSVIVHAAHTLLGEHLHLIAGIPADPPNLALLQGSGFEPRLPAWRDCVAEVLNRNP